MPNYTINKYSTGLLSSIGAANLALETRLEDLDASTNSILGSGILITGRDREQCIGWALFTGFDIIGADHLHYADNIDLTVIP